MWVLQSVKVSQEIIAVIAPLKDSASNQNLWFQGPDYHVIIEGIEKWIYWGIYDIRCEI